MNTTDQNVSSDRNAFPDFLYTKNGLKSFLATQNLHFSKALGQNVIIDQGLMKAILKKAKFPETGTVLEIGPGLGHLTWTLLERGVDVIAIEKDKAFSRLLGEMKQWIEGWSERLTILHEDALESDISSLAKQHDIRVAIGNLPYNVSVPVLFRLVYCQPRFDRLYMMVQKEVGERIVSEAGCKSYGRLSIVLNYLYNITKIRIVPPFVFFPQPHVESIFLRFDRFEDADPVFAHKFLERVVHIAFLHRRKKLRGLFRGSIVEGRVFGDALMEKIEAHYDLDQRAEEWPLDTWVQFARFIEEQPSQRETTST